MTESRRSSQTELSMRAASAPSFRAIYEAEASYLWNTLRRFGVYERDLEDLTHDVFVIVHRQLAQYDPTRPLRPWLCGIAFRVASDYGRRAGHRREQVSDRPQEQPDEAPLPDEHVQAAHTRRLVAEALEAVKLPRRAVFVLHDLDGFSVPEIARTLEIPLNTAYSRLRLARREFAAAVKRLQLQRGAA